MTIVVFLERMLEYFFGYRSIVISISSAFALGIIFVPLRNKIQRLVDQMCFHGTQEEFAQRIELLNKEVAKADKLKATATLASGIAHEIKNPLTAVKTFTEYLPNRLDDKSFLKDFSRIVGSEVSRIDEMVNQLLDFARPSPLLLKESDICKLTEDTLRFLNSKFINHKIKLIKDFVCPEPILIRVDPNQLKQALLNIFLNAIDAMLKGGTLRVAISLQSSESQTVVICIQDTGNGIDAEDLPHIFDPFFSKKDQGTGLGLSITHHIIQEHGGTINVESATGRGTKFTLTLPAPSTSDCHAPEGPQ